MNSRPAPIASYLALASAMLIVGTSVVASKIVVDTLPIYTASMLRFFIAAIVLLVIVARSGGLPKLTLRVHLTLALLALVGLVLFNVLLLLGLTVATGTVAGVEVVLALLLLVTSYAIQRVARRETVYRDERR